MKRVYGDAEASAAGTGWFKILDMGYDSNDGMW